MERVEYGCVDSQKEDYTYSMHSEPVEKFCKVRLEYLLIHRVRYRGESEAHRRCARRRSVDEIALPVSPEQVAQIQTINLLLRLTELVVQVLHHILKVSLRPCASCEDALGCLDVLLRSLVACQAARVNGDSAEYELQQLVRHVVFLIQLLQLVEHLARDKGGAARGNLEDTWLGVRRVASILVVIEYAEYLGMTPFAQRLSVIDQDNALHLPAQCFWVFGQLVHGEEVLVAGRHLRIVQGQLVLRP